MIARLLAWLRRRWLLVLVIIAFIVLIILSIRDIEELAITLTRGRWEFLLGAILLQVTYYLLLGVLYQAAFSIVQVKSRLPDLIPVLFASVFVTTLAPTGGVSGAALFVDDAARHEQSPARATEGVLLVWVAQNLGLLPVLAVGLGYLAATGALATYQLAGAGFFTLLVAALTGALFLGRWQPAALLALLSWLQRAVNAVGRLLRRPGMLPPDWAEANTREFSEAAHAVAAQPRRLGLTLGLAVVYTVINLASLYLVFLAYGRPVAVGLAAAGFSLSIAFAVISVLPLDVGVMQTVMGVVFTSQGVPLATALAVVLVFGGINAWLPLLIGFFFLRQVRAFGG